MNAFKPSLALTLALLPLLAIFLWLGHWQADRKIEKQALFDLFEQAPALTLQDAIEDDQRFARINLDGKFDPERHIMLDNRIFRGRAGVHVLTPFFEESGRVILVNRGWLPLPPDRSALPEVTTPTGRVQISGRLNRLPGQGPRLGEPDQLHQDAWPQLVTYFDFEPVRQALELDLEDGLVLLDQEDPTGFQDREWQPATMKPQVHGAYALQWYSLAVATICIWIILGVRRAR